MQPNSPAIIAFLNDFASAFTYFESEHEVHHIGTGVTLKSGWDEEESPAIESLYLNITLPKDGTSIEYTNDLDEDKYTIMELLERIITYNYSEMNDGDAKSYSWEWNLSDDMLIISCHITETY